jgi:hypothetical protein
MHQSAACPNQGGGTLTFVTGDLMDPDVCPGPFDVVIERRTLQLFPATEQMEGLERLIARLGTPGLFVSHQHLGCWRPGDSREHYARARLVSHRFDLGHTTFAPRLARLVFSTG